MTGPRKTGAQLTSSAASAQPQARRRLLPSCASSRGGPSAQHGLRHLPARRGKRLRSCACLHLPARPGSSGGRSVRSCGRRRTAAASKSHLVEVACELAALDPARGSKPGSNSRTRRAPRWRPRPTPEGTRFLFSGSKDLGETTYTYRSPEQTPTRTELGGYPLRFCYHRVGGQPPVLAHSFSSWVPTQVSLAQ